ncbi:hypothetical protein SAMN05720470_1259 [Fibrobacter sp. UWOV1]|uniref:hypothetical protein n=1 Tax=Fibrobacter sp. UWOV1 TaxID=1896215 RepID=UPI0009177E60|nr:hypothetical protein [Fibrobacter sp. UWOV1]SHL90589.1 hypothetical protein SAMN05720470_1259 [Fibrobacter sp. UWOV1]
MTKEEIIAGFLVSLSANGVTDMVRYVKATLLPHQMTNLSTWFSVWQPTIQDVEDIKKNEKLCRVFSVMFEKVQNEIFEEKLDKWGCIASNVVMGKHSKFETEKRFIKLFDELDLEEIEFLLKLKAKGEWTTDQLYPEGLCAPQNTMSERNCSLQVALIAKRLVKGTNKGIALTGMGEQFLDFVNTRYGKVERE